MKLIHCADLHLDSPMEANLSAEQARERKGELLSTFSDLIRLADENGVTAILIAGDLFDSARVGKRTKKYISELIASHPRLSFFYLAGNHDGGAKLFFGEDRPKNLYTFDDGWQSYRLSEDVTITASERPEPDTLILSEHSVNIVIMHGQERLGRAMTTSDTIPLASLKNKYIDYLALGHLHDYRTIPLDSRGVACYAGCLEGRGFDECGRKGYVLLEIENKRVQHTFVPFAKRELHTVECDITDVSSQLDLETRVGKAIEGIPSHHLVKLLLVGKAPAETMMDIPRLTSLLSERFYFAKLRDESKLSIDPEKFKNDISLKGEFVRRVMASGLKEDEKARVITCGFRVLSGEEVGL